MSAPLNISLVPVVAGATIILPAVEDLSIDAIGNVSLSWAEYITDLPLLLDSICATRVEQFRTHAGTFTCLADEGAKLFVMNWEELRPYRTALETGTISRSVQGVLQLVSKRTDRRSCGISAVLYKADAVYARVTGAVIG